MKRLIPVLILLVMLVTGAAHAQPPANTPAQSAESVRQSLFNAQAALVSGDAVAATTALDSARAIYTDELDPPIRAAAPALGDEVLADFAAAASAIVDADRAALAAARAEVWTRLLNASTQIVLNAVQANDASTASLWLPLREFRVATRFSRPNADATLAVRALANGTLTAEQAYAAVRADLYDTYQARLAATLADAEAAVSNGFAMRGAEESALAAGYFEMLAHSYGEQRGVQTLETTRGLFTELVAHVADSERFSSTYTALESALAGFRAVPLNSDELARRTGQLLRYLALVPIEYGRGVRNGVVTNDIEIQEALTFRDGAAAAFADLRGALSERDAAATTQIDALLDSALAQIQTLVEPTVLQATIDETNALLNTIVPPVWLENSSGADFDIILSILDQVEVAVAAGDYRAAESSRLEAYALLELGLEQRLRGFAPDMAMHIESLFWQGTAEQPGLAILLAEQAALPTVRAGLGHLRTGLSDAQLVLGAGNAAEGAVITNAAIIVFREGLEAVVILASLLASLRAAETLRFRRPIVAGAVLAFAATAITWVIANQLLTILLPLGERLEAIVSLIAIGVLLLITNWFFHKVYWTGWMANFHQQKRNLIGGFMSVSMSQTIGLLILGFSSIYREGFETVLFLQSLVLEAGIPTVLQGVALGLVGTAVVGAITFTLQVRLPYKKMLIVTGILIGVVLLTMVGNTVHVMQAVGWLPITPIQGVFLPFWMGQWFGLFATWQGVMFQLAAAVFVIGSYFLAEYVHHHPRHASQRTPTTQTATAVRE
jgi:high-affinity iron transporter